MPTYVLNTMDQFVCLGGACPDLCCRDWPVHLSRQDLQVLFAAVGEDPKHRQDILQGIAVDEDDAHQQLAGHIVWNQDKECPFLDAERLCGLYKRLGSEAQPAVCSQYPRSFVTWGDRVEMCGALSCPEVVRLLLELEEPLLWRWRPEVSCHPRIMPQEPCGGRESTPWCRYGLQVRQVLVDFLALSDFPLNSRLWFCALFAWKTLPEYTAQATTMAAEQALQQAMLQMSDKQIPALLHEHWLTIPCSMPMAISVIQAFANHSRGQWAASNGYFAWLVQEGLAGYGVGDEAAIHGKLLARQQALSPADQQWLDQSFNRFARHFLWQESLLHYPDLLAYIRRLVVTVQVCRFLFFGLLGEEGREVKATLHQVFHRFAKSFSHYRLDFDELDDLPKLLMFLRLW